MTSRLLHFYGELADRYGPSHEVCCGSISEALRIVECNYPGFLHEIRKQKFHVAVGSSPADAVEPPLHHLLTPNSGGDWHLVPALEGGKSRGFKTVFSIVVGGALLATGVGGALGAFSGGLGTASTAATGIGFAGLTYGTTALIGASFFLGGINQLVSPQAKTSTEADKPTTFSFSGPEEIDNEGGPIQIVIGEVICSGIRVASSIETGSASAARYQTPGGGGGGGGGLFEQFHRLIQQ